ncbi:MAG: PAS domain S-box protein [Deltaproteobacteria bacterium]|nr:PAS domain S-box protein [Deltaproteobacteria bacterium]
MTRLFMIKGPMQGRAFDLNDEITSIGRALDNDIQLDDPSVSRKHAKIFREGEKLYIEDLQSQNGTLINGRPITPFESVELKRGISIAMGNILFILGEGAIEKGRAAEQAVEADGVKDEKTRALDQTLVTDRKHLELIYEVSAALMRSLDLREICEKIMKALFFHFRRIDAGFILLVDPETGKLREVFSRARDAETSPKTKYSKSVIDKVLKDGKAVMISDTRGQALEEGTKTRSSDLIRSIMCVPLVVRSKVRGILYVHSVGVPQGFQKKDLALFAALSSPAAVALENARLYLEARRAGEALRKARDELEKRVEERTRELVQANERLAREVNERKRSEKALKESEEKYRDLFENAHDLIQAAAPDGRLLYVNRAWMETLEYTPEEVSNLSMFDVMAPECRDQCRKVVEDVLSGKGPGYIEAVFLSKGGARILVEGNINGSFRSGEPVSTRAILRDVTKSKRVEEALQLSEERFKNIAASTRDALITLDSDGRVSYWNKAAEEMFQYGADEVLGKELHGFLVPERYREAVKRGFETWKRTGEGPVLGKPYETTALKKDGTEFPVELSLSSTKVQGRWHAVGTVRDITERKRAEKELEERTEALDARVRQLKCLYGISRLREQQTSSLDAFLEGVVELLPVSFEGPGGVSARITLEGKVYLSPGFQEGPWKRSRPIVAGDREVGTLEVFLGGTGEERDPINREDETLLNVVAEQLGKAIEHGRAREALAMAREREVEIASRIQQALLLGTPPKKVPGLKVAAVTVPSQRIDGDFYDFFTQSDQCMDVLIGDVMGKGIPAALLGAAIKNSFVRALSDLIPVSESFPPPSAIVRRVHQRMVNELMELESFVTLCYARFDLVGGRAEMVDCGHTRTVHFHHASGTCSTVKGYNMPMGFSPDESYSPLSFPVEPGDVLVFYSDGITEARNRSGGFFGEGRLTECVKEYASLDPEDLLSEIRSSVITFSGSENFTDDLTCIVVKIEADSHLTPLLRLELEISSETGQLARLRDFVQDLCQRNINPPMDMDNTWQLGLAANEAATNIMKHAYRGRKDRKIHIVAEAYVDRILLRLNHWGEGFDPPDLSAPPSSEGLTERGYGLYLIKTYVDEVSYTKSPDGMNSVMLVKKRKKL